MKTLLTGACGFIGSRLAKTLQEQKNDGLILSDASSHRSRACFQGLEGFPFEDREQLLGRLDSLKDVSGVYHLGACTDTGVSDETFRREARRFNGFVDGLNDNQSVTSFDPSSQLCDGSLCHAYLQNVGLAYFNGDHLSVRGASAIFSPLADRLYGRPGSNASSASFP